MGYRQYSEENYQLRSKAKGYALQSASEIFSQTKLHPNMSPLGIKIRESRDSELHPNSVAILLGLDVTGSAGDIPKDLVVNGLPTIMSNIIESGIKDPQILFAGIGDHLCDRAPLQIGQFESSDDLLDHWLTKVWIEHGGGGNGGESYSLLHYLAAYHTSIDCFEKRGQKGFLFTIGDEPTHSQYHRKDLQKVFGSAESNKSAIELLAAAREKYDVYHFHLIEGSNGRDQTVVNDWKELMGTDHCILVPDYREIPYMISQIVNKSVHKNIGTVPDVMELPNLPHVPPSVGGDPLGDLF